MSIAKPFTFTANTYAKASEVNADFDIVYSQVNANISAIATNATDIDNLENSKADINGSSSQRFAVADPVTNGDAVNKQTLMKAIGNSIDYINGLIITKDSGNPDNTIIVSKGSCYDSTKAVVLSLDSATSKQNLNQGANTIYYVYIIGNSTGSLTDILISSESVTPSLPTGYTKYRKIGSYSTNSDSKIDLVYPIGYNTNVPGASSVVIESYSNGTSWYRVWSDGFCEQGGKKTRTATGILSVDLLKGYGNTDYSVQVSDQAASTYTSSGNFYSPYVLNVTESGFSISSGSSLVYIDKFVWEAKGYISV